MYILSDNVMTRVHLANNILVRIIMLLFKSQFKKLVKNIRANQHGPSFSRRRNFAQSWLNFCPSFSSPAFSRPCDSLRSCPSFCSPAFSGRAFSVAPFWTQHMSARYSAMKSWLTISHSNNTDKKNKRKSDELISKDWGLQIYRVIYYNFRHTFVPYCQLSWSTTVQCITRWASTFLEISL